MSKKLGALGAAVGALGVAVSGVVHLRRNTPQRTTDAAVRTRPAHRPVTVVNGQGMTLASLEEIDPSGDDLAVRATLLGTMPETMHVSAGQLWNAIHLLSPAVIAHVLKMAVAGVGAQRGGEEDGAAQETTRRYEGADYGLYEFGVTA